MLQIIPIPAFTDNYIWVMVHPEKQQAVIIDPGEANGVLDFLHNEQLTPVAVLVTHHHSDHTSGIHELLYHHSLPVYGAYNNPEKTISHRLSDNDSVTLFDQTLTLSVLAIPGHTASHIAYYTPNILFCGDTLFSAGCGRVFDGTIEQLYDSLERLRQLPDDTLIYCAHEYTLNNLAFAANIEPKNEAIKKRFTLMHQVRNHDLPTLPSTIAIEKATNPFLRIHEPDVITQVMQKTQIEKPTPFEIFRTLRAWKDRF